MTRNCFKHLFWKFGGSCIYRAVIHFLAQYLQRACHRHRFVLTSSAFGAPVPCRVRKFSLRIISRPRAISGVSASWCLLDVKSHEGGGWGEQAVTVLEKERPCGAFVVL